MNFTIEKTVKDNLCINCGICKTICKFNAISMQPNKYGEITPIIDIEKCKNCGQCLKYCPNSKVKLTQEAKKVTSIELPHTYGLQNASYYVAWDNNIEQRLKCCSGGAVTKLACHLLKQGKIDGMIHSQRLWANRGKLHYKTRISFTEDEIKNNVSSTYQALDFSDVLSNLEEGKTYFICGTPCVIRGLKQSPLIKKYNFITCALICSHNVNATFSDFLADMMSISKDKNFQLNMRYKDKTIKNANYFKNCFEYEDGTITKKDRFKSGWTHIWRSYYFAMNCCLYCPDFWGYEADISVKDAWGKWANEDAMGKSILVIRNKEIEQEFLNAGLIYEQLDFETMKEHQKPTPVYKQSDSLCKFTQTPYNKDNRKSKFCRYYINSKCSKFLYKHFGYYATNYIMKIISLLTKLLGVI